jgi:hypothetical protein
VRVVELQQSSQEFRHEGGMYVIFTTVEKGTDLLQDFIAR